MATPFVLLTFIKLVVLLHLHHRYQRFSIYVLRRILRFELIQEQPSKLSIDLSKSKEDLSLQLLGRIQQIRLRLELQVRE
mgnify:CR=1 FL=1